jgi:hypothetical protein
MRALFQPLLCVVVVWMWGCSTDPRPSGDVFAYPDQGLGVTPDEGEAGDADATEITDPAPICVPCAEDGSCPGPSAECVLLGDHSVCLLPCPDEGCDEGFVCNAGTCEPKSGACDCLADDYGEARECSLENAIGSCSGTEVCSSDGWLCDATEPTPETCNGIDDDCDGESDEDLEGEACDITNAFGACSGTEVCQGPDGWICQGEAPALDTCDGLDNDCDGVVDPGSLDTDGDGVADCVDQDCDDDGIPNASDNCICTANPDQLDTDADQAGDACDDDDDGDSVADGADNCPGVSNGDQADNEGDGVGDVCDDDDDDDTVSDGADNCPETENPEQVDTDNDGEGDACDEDDDADTVEDGSDNCPLVANVEQVDTDGDFLGDACDDDDDDDTILDAGDNCPLVANVDQTNTDGDPEGDACDGDDDDDTILDAADNCPLVANPDQVNTDGDSEGDACDVDDDDDTVPDDADNCQLVANVDQTNTDGDSEGDACDEDDDDDTILDADDNCPLVANPDQVNLDGDPLGDACDPDVDGDGFTVDDGDCDDNCADCYPGSKATTPKKDGLDQDCNGEKDDVAAEISKTCQYTPFGHPSNYGPSCEAYCGGDGKVVQPAFLVAPNNHWNVPCSVNFESCAVTLGCDGWNHYIYSSMTCVCTKYK